MIKHLGFIPFLISSYNRTRNHPGYSYEWDEKTDRISVSPKYKSLVWAFALWLVASLNALTIKKYVGQNDIVQLSLSIVGQTGLVAAGYAIWLTFLSAESCSKFLNSLLQIEEKLSRNGEQPIPEQKANKMALASCKALQTIEIVVPICMGCGSAMFPCSALNFLASINPFCINPETSYLEKTLQFLLISSVNALLWRVDLLKIIRSASTFNPMLYKMTKLANNYFNQFHRNFLFALMVGVCIGQACPMYVLFQAITSSPSVSIPILLILSNASLSLTLTLVNLFVFGVAGTIHTLSVDIIEHCLNLDYRKKKAEAKRVIRGCPPMNIAFGMNNFFEKDTPLKLFEYTIERFIDLLLLSKK